jgi:cation diffusion facilitator CzcD-associated flavoprotein CzcO/acetyl esterase/lipase
MAMASWQARAAALTVKWRVRPALGDMSDLQRVRAVFGSTLPPPRGVRFTPATLGGVAGEWVDATRPPPADAPVLMYVHGGGFIGGSPVTHRPVTAAFARRGMRVFVPDYRLAPEHPFPAALDDCVAAWRAFAAAHPGRRLVIAGDSAGGNLALALMLALRAQGGRLPDAAALFSPSTDLNGDSESLLANSGRDPMFHGPALEHLARAYLGPHGDPANPLISPVRGDLAGLPPLLLHVGADEVLRDDGLRFAAKARAAGVRVELVVWSVVPHAWQLVGSVPEARRSLDAAARFLKEAAGDDRPEHVDTIIVGAGLSGLGTAAHLQDRCPGHHFTILEGRAALGGTWDLFRYPGVRSDSDMYTLGYGFRPWKDPQAIAPGPAIRRYIAETAAERGLDRQVRFGHRVVGADWSSADARWMLTIERDTPTGPQRVQMSCRYLLACCGYYRYDTGHDPEFAGRADFRGTVVHPQFWPEGLDWTGKRVVVIGSGATAVTIVPEMARKAAQVTMLQRSPSYFLPLPALDPVAGALGRVLPAALAYRLVRAKNIVGAWLLYKLSRRWPRQMRSFFIGFARRALGPAYDIGTHFTPHYGPWDQRLCIIPNGDLFRAVRSKGAEVVTDTIERFTERGLRLASGRELEADIVVTATGLKLTALGAMAVSVDGRPVDLAQTFAYKAQMLSGVPNLVYTFGYTNTSWTLKADLTAAWTCRLLRYMDRRGYAVATPVAEPGIEPRAFLDLSAGYVQRSAAELPKQGTRGPWRITQDYLRDVATLRFGRIADRSLKFERAPVPAAAPAPQAPPTPAGAHAPGPAS